jgi:APA family basic amino acid/polyamine antiporter
MSAVLSLIVLRRREPQAPRPFRAWGYPWSVWIVFVVSLAFLLGAIASDPTNSAAALVLVALSWPVRWLLVREQPITANT